MMQIEYRRNLNRSYMIIFADCFYSGYEIEMFIHNKIKGFLPFETVVADGKNQFWYDITGKQSIDSWLESESLKSELLMKIVIQIYDICERMKKYLLGTEHIVLIPDCIYVENTGRELALCFFPVQSQTVGTSFSQLMEYLLQKIDHKDALAVEVGYEIYQWTLEDSYSLEEIVKRLEKTNRMNNKTNSIGGISDTEYKEEREDTNRNIYIEDTNSYSGTEVETESNVSDLERKKKIRFPGVDSIRVLLKKTPLKFSELSPKKQDPGKTARQRDGLKFPEESTARTKIPTEVLGDHQGKPKGRLRYCGSGLQQDEILTKQITLIGSNQDSVEIYIDSATVSRIHSKIVIEENTFYIEDMNSTNGTFVNGEEVIYKMPVALMPGDHVLFADEEYIFC